MAELLSPRSTRGTKRKNEIRTVPNGIVRGSTVIDRRSMNGPGIERRDRRMEEMGAAACTNRYAEPIFIASHRFHELCNSDDLYEISRPSLSLRIKEKASGIEEVDLSTFFFFFFFFFHRRWNVRQNEIVPFYLDG